MLHCKGSYNRKILAIENCCTHRPWSNASWSLHYFLVLQVFASLWRFLHFGMIYARDILKTTISVSIETLLEWFCILQMGRIHRAFLQSRHIRKVLLKKSTFWVPSRSSKELELDCRLPLLRDYHSSFKHLSWIPREVNPATSGQQNILDGRRRLSFGNQNSSGLTSLLGRVSILISSLGNLTFCCII